MNDVQKKLLVHGEVIIVGNDVAEHLNRIISKYRTKLLRIA
ncbi:hypothetical protein [Neomoorella mulderi]|uniref:Uncharacterized protein n=1 Tax=Moorella mulderi DSM 14980 TaxID=1122241 RepID=A0A151ATG2_9FIRM|nr:hypothetical protein [Moorella mulderi]KYH30687.1 hypothetical protein MOMUL_29690 [Moorella mulderi DSM 14980]